MSGPSTLRIQLLGRFAVRRGGEEVPPSAFGGRLVRQLVRHLVTRRGQLVSKDVLAEALWGERQPTDPETNLEILVSRARRAIGEPGLIVTGPRGYSFAAEGGEVDAERFLSSLESARALAGRGPAAAALDAYEQTLKLWAGEPLPEDAYADWAQAYRRDLDRAHFDALEEAAEVALAAGRAGAAAAFAERAVMAEPLREATTILLVRALVAGGDRAAALAAFDSFRRRYADELGLDPSGEAAELQRAILRGEPLPGAMPLPHPTQPSAAQAPRQRRTGELVLVGRERELEAILAALGGPDPAAVEVVGPSGAGKSRLLVEVAKRAPAPAIVVRAFPAEQHVAWELGRSLLRETLLMDALAARSLGDLQARALAGVLPELTDLRPIAEIAVDAESRQALAAEAALRLFTAAFPDGAWVLVDDLQWADASSLGLLQHVSRRLTGGRICVAYRPEELSGGGSVRDFLGLLREGWRHHTVSLGPLHREAILELVEDPPLLEALLEETDGLPQTIATVLNVLAQRGEMAPGPGGRWRARSRLTPEAARRAAREAARHAVAARIARLPSNPRELLLLLVLLGREAPARLLAEASGRPQQEVLSGLDQLARVGLVRLGEAGWAPSHDSVSDGVARSVSREERPGFHARLASALARARADPGEIARHLAGAGDHDAAAHAYADATADQLARFAHREAAAMVEAGLARAVADGPRARLLGLRAEARFRLGDLGGARDDLRAVLTTSSGAERALLLARLAMMEAGAEDYRRAQELAELAAAAAGPDRRAQAEARAAAGRIGLNLGDLDEAERQASRAEALFKEIGDAGGVARMIDVRAVVVFARGRILEALPGFEKAVHLFEELGELVRVVFPRCYLANCHIQSGRADRGLDDVERALELARMLGWAEGETFARCHASMASAALGSGEQAVREARHALQLARRIAHREWTSVALRTLGYAFLTAGQPDRAETALRESLELAGRLPIHAPWSAAGLALALTRRGRHDEAGDLVARATRALAGGWPTVRHEVDLARAEHLAARGDPQARHVAAEALARAESDGYVLHAARLRQLAGSAAKPGPRGYASPAS